MPRYGLYYIHLDLYDINESTKIITSLMIPINPRSNPRDLQSLQLNSLVPQYS